MRVNFLEIKSKFIDYSSLQQRWYEFCNKFRVILWTTSHLYVFGICWCATCTCNAWNRWAKLILLEQMNLFAFSDLYLFLWCLFSSLPQTHRSWFDHPAKFTVIYLPHDILVLFTLVIFFIKTYIIGINLGYYLFYIPSIIHTIFADSLLHFFYSYVSDITKQTIKF